MNLQLRYDEEDVMARQRIRENVYMGGKFPADLAAKFNQLSVANGISIREALRRLMVDAIQQGRVPGIDAMELDGRRNTEKFGRETSVATYDGEREQKTEAGRLDPAPRAE
jgi:hypothetical protein